MKQRKRAEVGDNPPRLFFLEFLLLYQKRKLIETCRASSARANSACRAGYCGDFSLELQHDNRLLDLGRIEPGTLPLAGYTRKETEIAITLFV